MPPAQLQIVASLQAEYSGRIAAAARETQERRDAAMVDTPVAICGLPIRRMTVDDYVALVVTGNAYVAHVCEPTEELARRAFWVEHAAYLVWFLSPEYTREKEKRDKFFATLAALNPAEMSSDLHAYLDEIFADAPRGPVHESDEPPPPPSPDPVGVSFAAHWVARIAQRFPWSRAEIRALPLPELFQYLRIIAAEKRAAEGEQPIALDDAVDALWAEMNDKITTACAARVAPAA